MERIGDYLLPASVSPQGISLLVPWVYIAIAATAVQLGYREYEDINIPSLNIEFEFDDIGGSTHKVLYGLDLYSHREDQINLLATLNRR